MFWNIFISDKLPKKMLSTTRAREMLPKPKDKIVIVDYNSLSMLCELIIC